MLLLYALEAEPHPIITAPLKITSISPYYIGDTINAEFTIANQGKLPINFIVLTVGGRDPDNQVADFSHRQNITLEPFESYNYKGTLTLNKVGDYHFFCAYQTPDGEWNTNVDVGSKLTDEDREEDIYVEEKIVNQPPDPPANLAQFKSNGETKIPIGGRTDEHNIFLKGKVKDPDGDKARLEVEIRRLDEYGGQFDEDAGGLKQSDLFENNSEIMLPVNELADGDYHWRARTIDEHDLVSEWISFGGNPDSAVDFTVGQEVVTPVITSPLKITTDSPYYAGDTINAEFTITNQGKLPISFSVLTVGGRDPNNHVSDFTHRQNITLEPFESYDYKGTLTLNKVGDYHFFCTYQTPDGDWNTNVNLGSGLTDGDRVEDIVVTVKKTEKEAVYITDGNNHRIQKFTSEGRLITKWGKEGNGDGEFDYPRGIAVDSQGNVYVTDGNSHRIQKFTSEGKFITKWGKEGNGDGEFDYPRGIAISRIYETEELGEKEKEDSPYQVEYKPIFCNVYACLLVNIGGPADELGIILTNPEAWSTTRFISKRDLIDNFESIKVPLCAKENPPSGTYNLIIKTITPEKIVYQKELIFTPPALEITDAEVRTIKTEGVYIFKKSWDYYLTECDIVVKNWGELPIILCKAVITIKGRKTQEIEWPLFEGVPYGETKIKKGGKRNFLRMLDEDIFDSAVIKLYSFSEEDCIAEYQARLRFDYYDSIWDYE